ncbi:MAG: hypothetical protein DGJ47_000125 [Rickettsiaceae bacterium]
MNLVEFYSLIFTDTLFANLAFSFTGEVALQTVSAFNNHNIFITLIVVISASMLAYIANYYLGKITFSIIKPLQNEKGQENNDFFIALKNNKIFRLFLFLSAMSIYGKFIVFFAGVARLCFKQVLLISFIAKLFYYSFILIF